MDDRGKMNEGKIPDKDYSFDEFNDIDNNVANKGNYKTRSNYGTGLKECFENCKCVTCKRERKGFYREKKEVA